MADNRLLAKLIRQHGGKILDGAIDKLLPADSKAASKKTVSCTLANAVLARVALRSVPGAILVGGGILAKRLHDKRKAKQAAALIEAHDTDLLSPEKSK